MERGSSIRDAFREKMQRDYPVLLQEEKRKQELIYNPFA